MTGVLGGKVASAFQQPGRVKDANLSGANLYGTKLHPLSSNQGG